MDYHYVQEEYSSKSLHAMETGITSGSHGGLQLVRLLKPLTLLIIIENLKKNRQDLYDV